jgi:hypothetical protein
MASEAETFEQAIANPSVNGSSFFPGNPFRVRPAEDAAAAPTTNHNPDDRNSHSGMYAMQAIAQPDGTSVEIVRFLRDHHILDLSAVIERTPVANIPAIGGFDLGGQHNALKLSLADVICLGETDLFVGDGKLQLMVNGKDGDSVRLSNSHVAGLFDGEWRAHGTVDVGAVTYNVIEHSSANVELLIEPAIHVDMH